MPPLPYDPQEGDMEKRWLSLKEAAKYSSIGEGRLVRMVEEGSIKGCQDEGHGRAAWILDKLSIDTYYENQMSGPTIRERTLAIMNGVRL